MSSCFPVEDSSLLDLLPLVSLVTMHAMWVMSVPSPWGRHECSLARCPGAGAGLPSPFSAVRRPVLRLTFTTRVL